MPAEDQRADGRGEGSPGTYLGWGGGGDQLMHAQLHTWGRKCHKFVKICIILGNESYTM